MFLICMWPNKIACAIDNRRKEQYSHEDVASAAVPAFLPQALRHTQRKEEQTL